MGRELSPELGRGWVSRQARPLPCNARKLTHAQSPCLCVLLHHQAQFRVVGPELPLRATVGEDVVLPCHLSPSVDARSFEIRWMRHQLSETVHHYRNGEDRYVEQMQQYAGRTELARDGLSNGILDLRITGLRPSDDGQYVCTVQDADSYGEATVDLEVAATGSVPRLSLEAYEDGGIRVVCRSSGWYPQPAVLWKDAGGQHLPSLAQRRSSDERGLFDIEDVIVVTGKGDGKRTCVVRNSRLDQEQASSLHISAPFFHNAQHWMIALGVFLVLSAVFAGLSAYLFRRKGKFGMVGMERGDRELGESFWPLPPAKPPGQGGELDVVTLDPDTAHSDLVLSNDLRRVTRESTWLNLPDILKRFDYWCCVLGREGFKEGRHCWEVEVEGKVGGDSRWAVGVARQSVRRKWWMFRSPKDAIWAVRHLKGQFEALTIPRTALSLFLVPRRILVCLDCTQGLVTFINAESGVEIFTFPPALFNGEIIRPWFWVGTKKTQLYLRG
uniref:BTN3 n=1 Tax=Nipponia nippon TaxID=128390 RepID=A0A0S2RSN9_NIPNI|nr:BTN3 [Nipponia nippon]